MHQELQIKLLGNVEISLNAVQLTGFNSSKSQALLCYLAVTGRTHARSTLVGMFWPELPETNAQRNLRKTLSNLRKLIAPYLSIDRESVALNQAMPSFVDIVQFERTVTDKNATQNIHLLQEAAELYRGDFLEGFYLRDAPEFDDWIHAQRMRYHGFAIQACQSLAAHFSRQGPAGYACALDYAQRQLALDPWCEEAHCQLMVLLAQNGRRSAALAQYERCCQTLDEELGVEPSAETTALYYRIRNNEVVAHFANQEIFNNILVQPTSRERSSIAIDPSDGAVKATLEAFSKTLPVAATDIHMQTPEPHTWGAAPDVSIFFGRQSELSNLTKWVVSDRCRLVGILGMGGIGKTAVATRLARQVQEEFDFVLWRSLRHAPPLEEILQETVHFLSKHFDQKAASNLYVQVDCRIARLVELLRHRRCLLIWDNMEAVLREGEVAGRYRSGYELYGQLIQTIGESSHQSCLIITSREKPPEFSKLQSNSAPIRSLRIRELDESTGSTLLREKGLSDSAAQLCALTARYSGNPLALKVISETIHDLYGGSVAPFLAEETLILGGVRELLAQQVARLSTLEQEIICWLAMGNPVATFEQLIAHFGHSVSKHALYEALHSLHYRSLLERDERGFQLPNVVTEYASAWLCQ